MTQDEHSTAPRQRKPISKATNRLTARSVAAAKPGRTHDGQGLWLVISKAGSKSWRYRFTRPDTHRVTEYALGSAGVITLSEARDLAHDARRLVARGGNPVLQRRAAKQHKSSRRTFGEVADAFITSKKGGWRSGKHTLQWWQSLVTYAAGLWAMPVGEVDVAAVLEVLKPIWKTKEETASRVRGRIESVLDSAKAQGLRSGENPAAWKGNLRHLLQERSKVERAHFKAMPYQDVPHFLARLREVDSTQARALEFTIATAARSGETLGARWSEFDLTGKVWTIPAARMKAGREHRVPLPARALETLAKSRTGECEAATAFVFQGKSGKPLSSNAMLLLLRKMGESCSVHGMRAALSGWASETTSFSYEAVEGCLAHTVGSAVARAYRRGDILEKRRAVLDAWGIFCEGGRGADVIPIGERQPNG